METFSWADTVVGHSRTWKIRGVQVRAQATATINTIRFKINGLTTATWGLRVSPATTALGNSQPFTFDITTMRYSATEIYYGCSFLNVEHPSFFSIVTANNVPALNVNALNAITVQSNVAQSSLLFIYSEVTAILN